MTVKHLCVLVECTENSHSLGEEWWFLGEVKRKYKFKSAAAVSFLETSDRAKILIFLGEGAASHYVSVAGLELSR